LTPQGFLRPWRDLHSHTANSHACHVHDVPKPSVVVPTRVNQIPVRLHLQRHRDDHINRNGCDWARLSDAAGYTVIAAETGVANQAIVDLLGSDAAFRTSGCGSWARYTAPAPPPLATVDEGDWVVGEQVEAGAYRVPQATTCTWTRATGFEHTPREVTQTSGHQHRPRGPVPRDPDQR
jgi:hypothetical protein